MKCIVLLKLFKNKETFKFFVPKAVENNLKINEIETFLNDGSEIFVSKTKLLQEAAGNVIFLLSRIEFEL